MSGKDYFVDEVLPVIIVVFIGVLLMACTWLITSATIARDEMATCLKSGQVTAVNGEVECTYTKTVKEW